MFHFYFTSQILHNLSLFAIPFLFGKLCAFDK